MSVQIFRSRRFFGIRIGRCYFKVRDCRVHPLLFSERHGYGYQRLARFGFWEIGVRR